MVEEKSGDGDYETFRDKLVNAKATYRGKESKGPRYAVYDFEYELESGEGKRLVLGLQEVFQTLMQCQEQDYLHRMVTR